MTTKKDLWGNLKTTDISLPYPYTRLKEQGELLAHKTNGLLIGELVINNGVSPITLQTLLNQSEQSYPQTNISHFFRIRVPTLNDYTYYVLEIEYPPQIYPVLITDLSTGESQRRQSENPEQFDQIIESILSSNTVKQTILMLLEEIKHNSLHLTH